MHRIYVGHREAYVRSISTLVDRGGEEIWIRKERGKKKDEGAIGVVVWRPREPRDAKVWDQ